MDDDNDDPDIDFTLFIVGTVAVALGFQAITSRTLEIESLNIWIQFRPLGVIIFTFICVSIGAYLYYNSGIIWARIMFRYNHPNTSLKGMVYLIPGVKNPYRKKLEELKKRD